MARADYNIRERMANRFEVDQRAALFGSRSGKPAPSNKKNDMYAANSREMMERQNDAQIEDLEAKCAQLKDITYKIGGQIKESHGLLDNMSSSFDKAAGLLKNTLGQLNKMMDNKSSKHMIYMVVFIVVLFFLMYVLRKLSFGGGGGGAPKVDLKANLSDAASGR
eukprot:TRINITY_DN47523_c0_g1_i1.p1 TRINITY_DN47523_c0_g1~~TRINITY_DN47523_c0_g1_i1.p1  ORF type:complete len:165 (+),score=38.71 TRINITY_DN47523_c0_g1_i1:52-546(+)